MHWSSARDQARTLLCPPIDPLSGRSLSQQTSFRIVKRLSIQQEMPGDSSALMRMRQQPIRIIFRPLHAERATGEYCAAAREAMALRAGEYEKQVGACTTQPFAIGSQEVSKKRSRPHRMHESHARSFGPLIRISLCRGCRWLKARPERSTAPGNCCCCRFWRQAMHLLLLKRLQQTLMVGHQQQQYGAPA